MATPRYFVAPDGSSAMEAAGGPLSLASVPEGWREVTAAEFRAAVGVIDVTLPADALQAVTPA